LDPERHEFFVYGGIAIPCEAAGTLHSEIETLREESKVPRSFLLKFNPGPEHLTHAEFIGLKKRLMEKAVDAKCTFLTTISHHKILTSADDARRAEINRISFHFNSLLAKRKDTGLILIDRFSDGQIDAHLREKFCVGLTNMPYSKTMRLDRVLGFHYAAIGQSHFSSLIDVLIGSMRFVIDAFTSQDQRALATASRMLAQMTPLFEKTSSGQVSVLSINFTPKIIKVDGYRTRYEALKSFLTSCGLGPEQEIREYRTY
jgi:hypothetical protein